MATRNKDDDNSDQVMNTESQPNTTAFPSLEDNQSQPQCSRFEMSDNARESSGDKNLDRKQLLCTYSEASSDVSTASQRVEKNPMWTISKSEKKTSVLSFGVESRILTPGSPPSTHNQDPPSVSVSNETNQYNCQEPAAHVNQMPASHSGTSSSSSLPLLTSALRQPPPYSVGTSNENNLYRLQRPAAHHNRMLAANFGAGSSNSTMPFLNPLAPNPSQFNFQNPAVYNSFYNNLLAISGSYPVHRPASMMHPPYSPIIPHKNCIHGAELTFAHVAFQRELLQKANMCTRPHMGLDYTRPMGPTPNQQEVPFPDHGVPGEKPVYSILKTADGQTYPVPFQLRSMKIPELVKGAELKGTLPHGGVISAVTLPNPSKFIFTGGIGVKIWNLYELYSRQPVTLLKFPNESFYVRSIKVLGNYETLIVGGETDKIYICSLNHMIPMIIGTLPLSDHYCLSLAMSPDSKTCYSCYTSGQIAAWDVHNQNLITSIKGHTEDINSMDISSDGNVIWTGSSDHTVRAWDRRIGRQLKIVKFDSKVYTLGISTNEAALAVGLENSNLEIVSTNTLNKIQVFYHEKSMLSVRFASNGQWFLSTARDNLWHAWATYNSNCLFRKREIFFNICCDISADGKYIATGSSDRRIRVYDVIY